MLLAGAAPTAVAASCGPARLTAQPPPAARDAGRLDLELGLHPREAAELMGHSPLVHLQTYGRRIERPALLRKVAGLASAR